MARVRKALPVASAKFRKESTEAHEVIYDRINDSLEEMDRALEDLALGVYMVVEHDGQERRIYQKEPNLEALKYRMDRVMGRPVARSESGQVGEFQGYEGFLQTMIDKRKLIVVPAHQEPKELPAASVDMGDTDGPRDVDDADRDRASAMRKLFG